MSKKATKTGSEPTAEQESRGFLDQNWNQRLEEARVKRAKNLSAGSKPLRKVSAKSKESRVGVHLTGTAAIKALFLFATSAGVALGAVLGIGILIGWSYSETATTQNIHTFGPAVTAATAPVEEPRDALVGTETTVIFEEQSVEETAVVLEDPELDIAPVVSQEASLVDPIAVEEKPPVVALAQAPQMETAPLEVATVLLQAIPEDVTLFGDRLVNALGSGTRALPVVSTQIDTVEVETADTIKVFIHAPKSLGNSQLASVKSKVEAAGGEVGGIGRESFKISTTHLRYYSPDSKDAAAALAAELGVKARDFSQNLVIPGRIEIWVAGQAKKSVVRRTASKSKPRRKLFSSSRNEQPTYYDPGNR